MFDTLHINSSLLPESDEVKVLLKDSDYQTKSLDNELTEIYINDDGSLTKMNYHYEMNENVGHGLFNSIKRIDDGLVTLDYTGIINFYTNVKQNDSWYEYNATFINGKLDKIVKIND